MFNLTEAHQHCLARESLHAKTMFVPEKDRYSKNAFYADLVDFFEYPGGAYAMGFPVLNQLIALLFFPIFLASWLYWRKFSLQGWLINFDEKNLALSSIAKCW